MCPTFSEEKGVWRRSISSLQCNGLQELISENTGGGGEEKFQCGVNTSELTWPFHPSCRRFDFGKGEMGPLACISFLAIAFARN